MCIIDNRDDWFGWFWDSAFKEKQIWIWDIKWMTLRQVICKIFKTTSNDIKNSPWLYGICGVPITDFNKVIDESFIRVHITKRFKKSKSDELFCPKWTKDYSWGKSIDISLTMEEYTFCSDYRLIVEFD